MKSRADADTFVVSMAGNREHCISLSFHGPSWSGVRIKTLSMHSCPRDGRNLFSFFDFAIGLSAFMIAPD